MKKDCQNGDILIGDMLREALTFRGIPQKHYYPIHPKMWDSFLELGYAEKQLTNYGFIKSGYIEVESDIEL